MRAKKEKRGRGCGFRVERMDEGEEMQEMMRLATLMGLNWWSSMSFLAREE